VHFDSLAAQWLAVANECNNRRFFEALTRHFLLVAVWLAFSGLGCSTKAVEIYYGKAIKFYDVFGGLNKYTLIQRDFWYFHKYSSPSTTMFMFGVLPLFLVCEAEAVIKTLDLTWLRKFFILLFLKSYF
jgi:hypothetical protein